MRKNKNVKKRQFNAAVNSHLGQELSSTAARKRKRKEPEYVDEDMIEDALLRLQVVHGALIHHTGIKIQTAEWIITFTQHISTIPYRLVHSFTTNPLAIFNCLLLIPFDLLTSFSRAEKDALDTAFCMESGQVKTGDNPEDTFVKMLEEINRLTKSIAYGITTEYPSVQTLVKGLKTNGPLGLKDLNKCANKDGAFADKRIGPSISKRVHSVFMGRDPGSYDV
jgi:crossover junction endonuclease EME1